MSIRLKILKSFIIILIIFEILIMLFSNNNVSNGTTTVLNCIRNDDKFLSLALNDLRTKGFSLESINDSENGYVIKVVTRLRIEETSSKLNELSEYNITDYQIKISNGDVSMEVTIIY